MRVVSGRTVLLVALALVHSPQLASAPPAPPAGAHGPGAPEEPVRALAPVEVVADGLREPWGLAVDPAGALHVADHRAGTVSRVLPDGRLIQVLARLEEPAGLAFDPDGRLLVVEARRGRLLRREGSGALTVLTGALREPRWLAVSAEGGVYVSARGLRPRRGGSGRAGGGEAGGAPDPGGAGREDPAAGEGVFRVEPDGALTPVAEGLRGVQGLALAGAALYIALDGLRAEREPDGVTLARLRLGPEGAAAPLEVLARGALHHPGGLAVDPAGGLFLAARDRRPGREAGAGPGPDGDDGVIVKRVPDGDVLRFAVGLAHPLGLVFDGDGHLYAAERRGGRGRVIRFRAPAPPRVDAPAATNRSPLVVEGFAAARSLVAAVRPEEPATPVAFALADPGTGRFALSVPLVPNARNVVAFTATGAAGAGLLSAPAEAAIVHDDVAPRLALVSPGRGAVVRGAVPLEAEAADDGSGVESVTFALDGRAVATRTIPEPGRRLRAEALLDTLAAGVGDGLHRLEATATDRAGNAAAVAGLLTVDNTPPDTVIAAGPDGEAAGTGATFVVTGVDNITAPERLVFSWRLDEGAWSAFGGEGRVALADLPPGPHVFEVRARDEAGNQDPSPAVRRFVTSALSVRITDPAAGATVASGRLVVRGVVAAGGEEVGVRVNGVLAAVQGGSFAAVVPVGPGTDSLTAVAATAAGATASHTIPVAPAPGLDASPVLLASPDRGAAPLRVAFSAAAGPAGAAFELDADGDGRTDASGPSLDGTWFTYGRPGLYVARLGVRDAQGRTATSTAIVLVEDPTAVDQRAQAAWKALRDALRRGDIPGALTWIVGQARPRYEAIFLALAPDLPQVDAILTDLFPVELRGPEALYEMTRVEGGVTRSFEVRFSLDEDGIRRLRSF